jgi:hypothetical protein
MRSSTLINTEPKFSGLLDITNGTVADNLHIFSRRVFSLVHNITLKELYLVKEHTLDEGRVSVMHSETYQFRARDMFPDVE